jgi:undecaprenyl-diphosphatase
MTLLMAALLGVLQGLTEFLPVSSTAHLLIAGRLLGFEDPGAAFTVMIQLGSILAVMWIYRVKILQIVTGLPSDPQARRFATMLLVAFLPTVVAGLFLADFITTVIYDSPKVFAATFILGGIVMLMVERFGPAATVHSADRTPVSRALGIGACQVVAMVPGVSRSGATIVGGMLMGLDRPAAAEFSFFLAMPTMMAAFARSLIKIRHDLGAERALEIGIGFVFAFLASWAVVKPFLAVVQRSGYAPFAWYRIALGLALAGAIAAGLLL